MRFLVVLLVLAVPFVAFGVHSHEKREDTERRLGAAAEAVAGRPVEVRCPGFFKRLVEVSGYDGSVGTNAGGRPNSYTELSASTCSRLDDFARAKRKPSFDCLIPDERRCHRSLVAAAHALETLAHEAYHLVGVMDEAAAQCYAVQTVDRVAVQFGSDPRQARLLAVWAAATSAARHPVEYTSSECRPGGALDLTPGTTAWP